MPFDRHGLVSAAIRGAKTLTERRGSNRTPVSGVLCDRGQVVDLSTRGMRLITRRRWTEGHVRRITLTADGACLKLTARCVWCRQDGMFQHAVGLAFERVTDEQAEVLELFATSHATEDHSAERPAT